jgi:hypothetical protein
MFRRKLTLSEFGLSPVKAFLRAKTPFYRFNFTFGVVNGIGPHLPTNIKEDVSADIGAIAHTDGSWHFALDVDAVNELLVIGGAKASESVAAMRLVENEGFSFCLTHVLPGDVDAPTIFQHRNLVKVSSVTIRD